MIFFSLLLLLFLYIFGTKGPSSFLASTLAL